MSEFGLAEQTKDTDYRFSATIAGMGIGDQSGAGVAKEVCLPIGNHRQSGWSLSTI